MAVQPQAECKIGQRCHINGKGLTRFGSKFPKKLVATAAASSVVIVIDDGGPKRVASGTLIWPNVVLCAAHTFNTLSRKEMAEKVQILAAYEFSASSAPAGDQGQYAQQPAEWEKGTPLATQPQAKVVAVLEMGDGADLDYALLAIEWTNTTDAWGSKIVTLPRAMTVAKPGTGGLSSELLVVGHPWGAPFQGQVTQASVGVLTYQMAPHPDSLQGTEYGYASFSAAVGFSGGGVFNTQGQLVGVLHGQRFVQRNPREPVGPCFLDLSRAVAKLAKSSKTTHANDRLGLWFSGEAPLMTGDPNQKVVFKTA